MAAEQASLLSLVFPPGPQDHRAFRAEKSSERGANQGHVPANPRLVRWSVARNKQQKSLLVMKKMIRAA
jgi:hypothetical protein